ncbi:MAG: GspE/PulE family protein [Verrucomicrobiota bacterium]|nr:GspE/PulE family protein [Verrucomicrobiota bacterium]
MSDIAILSPLDPLISRLDDEQRTMLEESPRQNRPALLAQFRRETELQIIRQIGELVKLEVVESFDLVPNATSFIPLRLIHQYQVVPFIKPGEPPAADGAPINLITLWPPEPDMDEWIYAASGKHPRWYLSPAKAVINCITQNFGVGADSLSEGTIATEDSGRTVDEAEDENAALIRFVNDVIQKAIEDRATDIHFEPLKESLQIRYRIDGELVPIRVPDNLIRYQGAIISRLKIMARLNISEKRRPQDGRITYKGPNNVELDIRISTIPTMYGESVSLRLLNQKNQPLSFDELGMLQHDQSKIKRVLELPHGIVLVTGPTGSGKSTSLTAFIRHINRPGLRIITVEDPVEYEVPGVNQTQVHTDIGFTFAAALRHILRQDPDVIMVGEIRDRETADIAIRASLTGHLVLSTLHTNDAAGAITRLVDMDLEPFLIASAVEMVIAQRLVRRLCPECARPTKMTRSELEASLTLLLDRAVTDADLNARVLDPVGCEACRGLGYRGRVGLFEILRMDETIHELTVKKATARQIREVALANGMITLQESGWEQVRLGRTSLSEVMYFSKIAEDA